MNKAKDKNRVTNYKRIAGLLSDLIRIESVSGLEGNIAKRLLFLFNDIGADAYIDTTGNLIATIGHGPYNIVLDAHMDTVLTGQHELWQHNPFEGYAADNFVYGRGATDMKGALAAIFFAFENLLNKKEEWEDELTIIFIGAVLEEPAEGVGLKYALEENEITPNLVIITEPSSLKLIDRQRGRAEFKIWTKGVSAHGAYPDKGSNAVYKMADIIKKIEALNKALRERPAGLKGSVAVTNISSRAVSKNGIPEYCEITIDRRLDVDETQNDVFNEIENISGSAKVELTNFSLTSYTGKQIKGENYFPSWKEENAGIKGVFDKCYEQLFGSPPAWDSWKFGTDGSYSKGIAGIPTIGFGPGNPDEAHITNEKINIADVYEASMFYSLLPGTLLKTSVLETAVLSK